MPNSVIKSLPAPLTLVFFFIFSSNHNTYAQAIPTILNGIKVIVTQSPKIIVKTLDVSHNKCYGESKGAINIGVSGGYPPYKYYWSHGDTTQDVAALKAGTYKVAVYDGFSCSDTLKIIVEEPEKLRADLVAVKPILCYGYDNGAVDISISGGTPPYSIRWNNGEQTEDLEGVTSGRYSALITDASGCQEILMAEVEEKPLIVQSLDNVSNILCHGDNTGSIDISVSGGVSPYTYLWNNGETSEDIKDLKAGLYEVVVKDAEGCTEVSTTKVKEPDNLTISLDEVRHLRCSGDFGGAINISVQGGRQPYLYEWSNGATTQDIVGVPAGHYTVQVKDKNGCSGSFEVEVTEPEPLNVALVNSQNVLFHGGSDGAIDIDVFGGIAPYQYKWDNGSQEQDISGLEAGSYSVRITDAIGCAKMMSITITQPAPLIVKINDIKNINCKGMNTGEINISAYGGIAPYTYKWSNGADTQDISLLQAGRYSVTVTDSNGVEVKADTLLTEPSAFTASIVKTTDILCYGEHSGAVDVDVSGGVMPYKYSWSNGHKWQDLKDVPAGEYHVKIMDANQCEQQLSVTIKQPEPLKLTFDDITYIKCFGNSEGAINVSTSGGVEPYRFQWNNGTETEDIANIPAGIYNLTVTDDNGCVQEIGTEIIQPELLSLKEERVKHLNCNGSESGAISLSTSGGVAPYAYSWNNGATTKDIANLSAGDYKINVTDASGCEASYSKTITEPEKLTSRIKEITSIACFAEAKGSIDINVTGGTQPYKYKWSNGAVTQDIATVNAGTYSVLIADANGCMDSLSAVISHNPELTVSSDITNINCNGERSGAVMLAVNGGVAPYTYKWSNDSTSKDISGVTAGNYSVTVTDAKGCSKALDNQIIEPSKFVASIGSEKHVTCYGEKTGEVNVRISGGVEPYIFKWNNGATTRNLTGVAAGEYQLLATDANGCTQTVNAVVLQPEKIEYGIKSITHVSCFGEKTGAIDIFASGGSGPYTYEWSNGTTTQDLQGVKPGKYTVRITDVNECHRTLEADITGPPALTLQLKSVENILCYGQKTGAVDLNVSGGVAPYTYSWSNGDITQDISGLPAGDYTVTVKDANGCSKSVSAQIKQPAPLKVMIKEVKHLVCNGDKNGAIMLDIQGGVEPYLFKWSNGINTQNLTGAGAGIYTVDIADANGCIQQLKVEITQPSKLINGLTHTKNVSCFGEQDGEINISVNEGSAPYQYLWSNGSQLQDLNGIPAGAYDVRITDAKGCKDSLMNIEVSQPPLLEVKTNSIAHIYQYGQNSGAIDIAVAGGTSPYSYSWSNGATTEDISSVAGGNYSVNIKDANACEKLLNVIINQPPPLLVRLSEVKDIKCNGDKTGEIKLVVSGGRSPYRVVWSNGDSTQNIKNLAAGNYSVKVTDANGNSKILKTTIAQPSPLTLHRNSVQNLSCFNDGTGAIHVTATGGIKPYIYQWNTGSRDEDISGLQAGFYSLTVTDSNNCTSSLTAQISQPNAFEAQLAEVKNINCNGNPSGEIHLDVKGGVKPYSYFWNNGERTKDLTDIPAGDYIVKVTDANGCSHTLDTTLTEPSDLVIAVENIKDNLCYGENRGAVAINVTGGVAPFTFNWSNGAVTQNLRNEPSGNYSLMVTDANGCQKNITATINEPPALVAEVEDIVNVSCHGESTGEINVSVSGGVGPYTYQWNNGMTEKNLNSLEAGLYQLTVTDINGCSKSLEAEVSMPEPLTVTLDTIGHVLCNGNGQGFLDITVRGGKSPYMYTWSNGANTEDLESLIAGEYVLNVQDANGCFKELTAIVEQPEPLTVQLNTLSDIKCWGDSTGEIYISASGGVGPYRYQWNTGATEDNITNAPAGAYKVNVTDANGCTTLLRTTISQPPKLKANIDAITNIRCSGDTSGSIRVTALEGVAPYTFRWNNGATTKDIRGIRAGDYELTITEGNGCETVLEATVEEPEVFTAAIDKIINVKCYGDSSGAIAIKASGGVKPYNFAWSNGSQKKDIEHIPADSYSVMITDGNGCIKTIYSQVKEPPALSLQIDSVKNVKCCGDNNGAIYITVEGGAKPYNYLWSNGATTEDITNLVFGEYTVEVTDSNNCSISSLDEMNLYEQVVTAGKYISTDILFDVAKSTIKPESFAAINKIATFMKKHPEISFRIDGHTDSDGPQELNQTLSEERAAAVKRALIKFGIWEYRLTTSGYGESAPIATNATAEGKALNRRVEFILLTGTMDGLLVE